MKSATLMVLLASTALAIPTENVPPVKRQSLEAITDHLYYQCQAVTFRRLCRALADVYYAAVRTFGGLFGRLEISGTDDDLLREYEETVAIYNALVQVAQKYGDVAAGNGTI
ncbi:hypothetical protein B0I37DRAFT_444824 [Chaetomium sp. MPI-CAGE-AT-0009]|nr:hypothetical protein B0I37DRAFT_444824 [Chaetomium sp. MPI-CAGE-AT-0009]